MGISISLQGAASTAATDAADIAVIHPEEFVSTRLSVAARDGDRAIVVDETARLDPRALLLLRTANGRIQEVHCIKSIEDRRVKLTRRLRHDFPAATMVIQASMLRDRGGVGSLSQPGGDGNSTLVVADAGGIDALQRVVVSSPDGRVREAHCISWVRDNQVRLAGDLRNDFPSGSSLVQGDLVGGELALDKPCCCEGKGKCCVDRLVGEREPPPPPPLPPFTVTCEAAAAMVTQGGTASVRAVVSGADPNAVSYAWSVDGRPLSYSGSNLELSPVDLAPGQHSLLAVATAPDDRTASCDVTLTVQERPNRDPVCPIRMDPSAVTAGEPVRVSVDASDPDGDPLTYGWTLDEQPYPDTSPAWTLDTTPLGGGNHLARVAVRDGRGGLCSAVAVLSVREKIQIQIDNRADNVAKAQLDEIALKLQSDQQLVTTITGHTDSTGAASANQRVGLRRATLLRDYLVTQHRIDPNRIEVRSAGSEAPVASNLTAEGRQQNRRAEVELYVPGS